MALTDIQKRLSNYPIQEIEKPYLLLTGNGEGTYIVYTEFQSIEEMISYINLRGGMNWSGDWKIVKELTKITTIQE